MKNHHAPSYHEAGTGPFRHPIGRKIGAGGDNKVYEFHDQPNQSPRGPHRDPRYAGELVVKASNKLLHQEGDCTSPTEAIADAKYKKAKYDLLRFFLGRFVPNSYFLPGSMNTGNSIVNKSYTAQERLPQYKLSDLPREQRNLDELRANMYDLTVRLQVMHQVLGRAREIVESRGHDFLLEDSLDLGPYSKYVREHMNDNAENFSMPYLINGFKSSPNLLVNPETSDVYCIDFGQGQWNDRMAAQLGIVYDIARNDPDVSAALAA